MNFIAADTKTALSDLPDVDYFDFVFLDHEKGQKRKKRIKSSAEMRIKRKKEYKNVHLSEYVDIEKMHRALETLKNSGHPEYQFYEPTDWNKYADRCKADDPEGYNILYGEESEDEIVTVSEPELTEVPLIGLEDILLLLFDGSVLSI